MCIHLWCFSFNHACFVLHSFERKLNALCQYHFTVRKSDTVYRDESEESPGKADKGGANYFPTSVQCLEKNLFCFYSASNVNKVPRALFKSFLVLTH